MRTQATLFLFSTLFILSFVAITATGDDGEYTLSTTQQIEELNAQNDALRGEMATARQKAVAAERKAALAKKKAEKKALKAQKLALKADKQAQREETAKHNSEVAEFRAQEKELDKKIQAIEAEEAASGRAALSRQKIPTKKEVKKLKKKLTKLFTKECGEDGSRCPDGDRIGAAIRLAFHDVAAFDHSAENFGGANGCMEWDAPSHKGLGQWPNPKRNSILGQLDNIHNKGFKNSVSRADLWQYASYVALHVALPVGHKLPKFKFRWGRVDADECSEELGNRLPNAEKPCSHAFATFARMGFTPREMVTLMGAHTLGKSEAKNTGYHGKWVRQHNILDGSDFYRSITDVEWIQVHDGDAKKTQWMLPRQVGDFDTSKPADDFTMLLNTDVCIAFDIDKEVANPGSPDACIAGGKFNTCPRSPSFHQVRFFGNSNKRWLRSFSMAFGKAMNLGVDVSTLRNPRAN